ncbi:hypothetical protein Y1Q_0022830 [Alligator mississippiensis]|nr:hypothetical protein Y1Q_0022830 [Alligator mississippiensis]
MVWRKLLRKRWVLGIVFGLSLIYFLTSTFKQEERSVRDRNLLQVQDHEQPIVWKVQFSLGNSSQLSNQCRNSVQGKLLITDELGYICERKDLLVNGCCNVNVPHTKLYSCYSCLPNGCCSVYEYCVSCCLQPNKQHLLERFLNRAAIAFQNLFMAVEDHFELCLAKCRTSSQSVQHENTYRDPIAKYCYGEKGVCCESSSSLLSFSISHLRKEILSNFWSNKGTCNPGLTNFRDVALEYPKPPERQQQSKMN